MKYWLFLFSITISLGLNGQNRTETKVLAEKLIQAGNYASALRLYERMVFFASNDSERLNDLRAIANCYRSLGQVAETINSLEGAITICDVKAVKDSLILEKADLLIRGKQFFNAQQELFGMGECIPQLRRDYNFLLGVSLYGTNSFEAAQKSFMKLVTHKSDSQAIADIFMRISKKLDPRRPIRAKHMSMILPGSGQFMAGDIRSGINSLLLVGLAGYLYYISVSEYGFISGVVAVLPWFTRYHSGGGINAARAMSHRQARHKHAYFQEILTIVYPK